MKTFRTEGVILKKRDLRETDRLLTLYTKSKGKITAKAKGVRKITSRLAPNLELFTFGSFFFAEGKINPIITGITGVKNFDGFKRDLTRVSRAYYAAEIVDRFTPHNEPSARVFSLLAEVLGRLADADSELPLRYFEWRMLELVGYRPELFVCVRCTKPPGERPGFSVERGGVVCAVCAREISTPPVALNTLKLLRLFSERPLEFFERLSVRAEHYDESRLLFNRFIRHIFDTSLSAESFLSHVKAMTQEA